ncbi:MAG: phospho-N-acetylmuramoyl-pentapeptide-transferase [Rhodothermia bacterium]
MLYYLIDFLEQQYQPAGFQVIYFITVRAGLAAGTALVISLFAGKRIIRWLQDHQFKERIREGQTAGVVDHSHKAGTPTMGGIIILLAVIGSTLLWGAIGEVYIQLIILATIWMGAFGFADDYIKVIKGDKGGLRKRTKITGQVSLGLILGAVLYFHPQFAEVNSLTNLPFSTDGIFDYDSISRLLGLDFLAPVVYILVVVFIVTALSNAANLTDGLDGLAAGVASVVSMGLVLLSYVAGNAIFSDFLNMMFLPGTGELAVFAAALTASGFGFLWYNGFPAQVFMGDTGSMALGAAIGTLALMIKIELLLPLLCGAFLVETASVIIQTSWFRYTRKKTGTGRRVFLMAPIHHHYEALGIPESKIVIRFWIVTAILVIGTLLTFRIR